MPFRTAGSKNHFPVLFIIDQMTLALSPLEATWRTKQKDPHTKLMFIRGAGWVLHRESGGYTWPWSSNEHNRRDTNWHLKPLRYSSRYLVTSYPSFTLSVEQRGSSGCLDFCKCFTHLVVVYHLDRMLHLGFFSPLYALQRKWLLYALYLIHEHTPFILRSKPMIIGNRKLHLSEWSFPLKWTWK